MRAILCPRTHQRERSPTECLGLLNGKQLEPKIWPTVSWESSRSACRFYTAKGKGKIASGICCPKRCGADLHTRSRDTTSKTNRGVQIRLALLPTAETREQHDSHDDSIYEPEIITAFLPCARSGSLDNIVTIQLQNIHSEQGVNTYHRINSTNLIDRKFAEPL